MILMIKNIRYKQIALIVLALSLNSCNKDFLGVNPPDQIPRDLFWKTEQDAELVLTGCYSFLYASGGGYSTSQYTMPAWDNFSDNSYGQYDYGGGRTALLSGITPPEAGDQGNFVSSYYTNNYQAIAAANYFLANVGRVISGEKMVRYSAEAHFLRAFNYLWLAQLYGNVPITLQDPYSIDLSIPKAKSSRTEVLKLVNDELDLAIKGLPDLPYSDGHAVKITAQGYKLRSLMLDGKFAEAAKLAAEIISGGKASLNPSYLSNFYKPDQNASEEILFSVKYQLPNRAHQHNALAVPLQRWKGELATQDLIDEYEAADGRDTVSSSVYVKGKPFENRDPRLRMTFFFPGDTKAQGWPFSGVASIARPGEGDWIRGYYAVKKWLDPRLIDPDFGLKGDNDLVLMRYADVLLLYAEAQNEVSGPDASVYQAINTVRQRVGMPGLPAGLSKTEMSQRIRHERRVEFALEGIRYFDIRRWGIAKQKLNGFVHNPLSPNVRTRYEQWYDYWPIPRTEVERNVPEMIQNPGY
jgi:hypothetical protein